MKIGFIFTNYNNSKVTINAIESINLLEGDHEKFIVIVDNDSDEIEKEILSGYRVNENTLFHFSDKNLGYFKGLNLGLELISNLKLDLDFIIIGNNDLIFPKEFVTQINNQKVTLDKYPVISPNIITLDGIHQNPHVIDQISKLRELIYDIYYSNYYLSFAIGKIAKLTSSFTDRNDEQFYNIPREIVQGYGACYILTKKFIKEIQTLWSPTFMMAEEYFFSLQLQKLGYKFYYEPTIIVKHQCHATMGKLKSKFMWNLARDAHKACRMYHVQDFNKEFINEQQ
jgi:GT2 family glycosyltransferase